MKARDVAFETSRFPGDRRGHGCSVDHEILGKPLDPICPAYAAYARRSDAPGLHGAAVTGGGVEKTACERTDVRFADLSESVISDTSPPASL